MVDLFITHVAICVAICAFKVSVLVSASKYKDLLLIY